MDSTKSYVVLGVLIIGLFFLFVTISKIEEPLLEMAKLPRCEETNIPISEHLRSDVIKFSNDFIRGSTGEEYFDAHYRFLMSDYSTTDCVFLVRYSYFYGDFHTQMAVSVKVFSEKSFEVINTNALLSPVRIVLSETEAEELAEKNSISYDYYNLEVNLREQTLMYTFYKETIAQGKTIVFEVDAQSGAIKNVSRAPEIIPIV